MICMPKDTMNHINALMDGTNNAIATCVDDLAEALLDYGTQGTIKIRLEFEKPDHNYPAKFVRETELTVPRR